MLPVHDAAIQCDLGYEEPRSGTLFLQDLIDNLPPPEDKLIHVVTPPELKHTFDHKADEPRVNRFDALQAPQKELRRRLNSPLGCGRGDAAVEPWERAFPNK